MEQARDFWAMADRSLLNRWPKGADGQPEKAEKLTWQPELGGYLGDQAEKLAKMEQ